MNRFTELVPRGKVIPVVTINDSEDAAHIARALFDGGIQVIEVALRTDAALDAIRRITQEVPDMLVGAGTIKHPADVQPAVTSGAAFLVSPGTTMDLLSEVRRWDIPFLPAASSPTESLTLLSAGYDCQKLFPADVLGGFDYLNAIRGPIPEVTFCPSGGVNAENYCALLALSNVYCVSGSWITPTDCLEQRDWRTIKDIALGVSAASDS